MQCTLARGARPKALRVSNGWDCCRYTAAFNARDAAALLSCMSPDCVHHGLAYDDKLVGRQVRALPAPKHHLRPPNTVPIVVSNYRAPILG